MAYKKRRSKDFETWHLMHEVDTGIFRAWENKLRPFHITPIGAALMHMLYNFNRPMTLSELSLWLFRKPHSISELVTRMSKQGLVKKKADTKKRGMVNIALTKKGVETLVQSTKTMAPVGKIMSALSEEEADNLMKYLEKLRIKMFEELTAKVPEPLPWDRMGQE